MIGEGGGVRRQVAVSFFTTPLSAFHQFLPLRSLLAAATTSYATYPAVLKASIAHLLSLFLLVCLFIACMRACKS